MMVFFIILLTLFNTQLTFGLYIKILNVVQDGTQYIESISNRIKILFNFVLRMQQVANTIKSFKISDELNDINNRISFPNLIVL